MKRTKNISFTLKHDLCTGCGVCVGACPTASINMRVIKGCFRPQVNNNTCINAKGCHRCFDTCPGIGVNLKEIANNVINDINVKSDEFAGRYIECYTGYSNSYDIRYHSASGGMVSQFLIWLLENDIIDGAYVTAFNKDEKLKVISYIASTKEDILRAKGSKYAPVTFDHAIKDIKEAKGKKYVIIGIPCQIEGFRKYEKLDKKFKEKIFGYFSIYCSSGRSFYFTEYIFKERNLDLNGVTYLAYRDNGCLGGMVVKGIDTKTNKKIDYYQDYQKYCHPLRSIFVPNRCNFCIDHYGELADISFGDIHLPPYSEDKVGINSIIVRSNKWNKYLLAAREGNAITLNDVDIAIINKSQPMSRIKKHRNSTLIRMHNFLFRTTPKWDDIRTDSRKLKSIIAYFHINVQQYIGRHKILWPLIKLIKG